MVDAPVAYIVFNRPRHTERTFAAIRAARPSRLFVIADGPRAGNAADAERVAAVRDIVSVVDWPCQVERVYSEQNLGCKLRPSSGIDHVFSRVERAIILEDDCLPHPDFFAFCDALLDRYDNDPRVYAITGQNYQRGVTRGDGSYYFSRYNHVWGWATWRRAWRAYDGGLSFWPEFRRSEAWRRLNPDPVERRYWTRIFDRVHAKQYETAWDYPWTASVWHAGGLTATPNVNLVSNIGFGPDATHTLAAADLNGAAAEPLGELQHPASVERDAAADRAAFDNHFGGSFMREARTLPGLARRAARRLKRLAGGGAS